MWRRPTASPAPRRADPARGRRGWSQVRRFPLVSSDPRWRYWSFSPDKARTAPTGAVRVGSTSPLMLLYNNVAELRQFSGGACPPRIGEAALAAGPDHLDIQVADLLAQGVAVQPQQIGGPDLVTAGRGEGCRQ